MNINMTQVLWMTMCLKACETVRDNMMSVVKLPEWVNIPVCTTGTNLV